MLPLRVQGAVFDPGCFPAAQMALLLVLLQRHRVVVLRLRGGGRVRGGDP